MLVAMPQFPRAAAKIEWKLRQPSQMNRGEFTGYRRVTILAEAPRWTAHVEYPPIIGERAARPWRSFFAQLQGRAGTFQLVACEAPQVEVFQQVVVDGAGQTGNTLATRGWQAGAWLGNGMFVTVGDRLHQVVATSPIAGADGKVTLSIIPYLENDLADGVTVETRLPWALMSLSDDSAGWSVGTNQQYAIAFDCEEAL